MESADGNAPSLCRRQFVRLISYPDPGPAKWHESFPIAKEGKRQSPIDLCSEAAVTDDSLRQTPFSWSYDPNCCLNVENTGSSFKVNVDGKNTSEQALFPK